MNEHAYDAELVDEANATTEPVAPKVVRERGVDTPLSAAPKPETVTAKSAPTLPPAPTNEVDAESIKIRALRNRLRAAFGAMVLLLFISSDLLAQVSYRVYQPSRVSRVFGGCPQEL